MTKVGCAQLESSVFCAVGLGDLLTGLTLSADCHLGPLTRAPQFSCRWPLQGLFSWSWCFIMEEKQKGSLPISWVHLPSLSRSYTELLFLILPSTANSQARLDYKWGMTANLVQLESITVCLVQKIFTFPQRCKNILAPSFKSTSCILIQHQV